MAWWVAWAASAATTGTTGNTGTTGDTGVIDVPTAETGDTATVPPVEDPPTTVPPEDTGEIVPPTLDTGTDVITAASLAGEKGGLACDTTGRGAGFGLLVLLAFRRRGSR